MRGVKMDPFELCDAINAQDGLWALFARYHAYSKRCTEDGAMWIVKAGSSKWQNTAALRDSVLAFVHSH